MSLESKIPAGPIAEKWERHKRDLKPVNPANKRKYSIIVVGTGLAGASAAASLAEMGYNVKSFCYQDSARRAHSIAAYDTVKGGDYRAREANVHRLAEVSANIIDQAVAQGVPFAREYGGDLANRSFGGALVSRTFYARGQTGQQLLLGAYSALMRQVDAGQVQLNTRTEMQDLIVVDGVARGIVTRDLLTGKIEAHTAHMVLLCTGGYSPVFYLSTNAVGCNVTAAWRAAKRGAYFANPCYTQIHPTCIPVHGELQSKLTLMSESLRNDGRVWVPKEKGDKRLAKDIPEADRDYYLERIYPSFGNLVPRDVASRVAKRMCDQGQGVGDTGLAVFLDFEDAIKRLGQDVVRARYGNLFQMYEKITGENPYERPMRIYPAPHYTMGGLWVDYNLQSTIPGLYVLGEANFSDHGANRLGASALMQGLADGYFVAPYTAGVHLNGVSLPDISHDHDAVKEAVNAVQERQTKLLGVGGSQTPDHLHRRLGRIMWEHCGMARNKEGLATAKGLISELREEFWKDVKVPGTADKMNPVLEKAARVADFMEFAELMVDDAAHREESCGGHFRTEHQTDEGEAKRNDDDFSYVAAWEYEGPGKAKLHKEPLTFEEVQLTQRSYK
ncbi:MAG: fumarate reductase/succinate dehydrogenase flavoprotein subunit [Planctomycetota bacterium]|jgi:succinate dehydrogenase / fumarate reductase flavoprotein subunit